MAEHKKVITEIIGLFRDSPCLWDYNSESYKDIHQKHAAWDALVNKYKEIEPEANVTSMKKKMENLKTAYKRELRKVQNAIRRGEVHRPYLWYYDLMTFLDKRDEQPRSGIDNSSDDESEQGDQRKKPRLMERRKTNIDSTLQELLQQESNSVGPYDIQESEQGYQRKKSRALERKKHKLIDTAQELLQKPSNSFGLYVGEQLEMIPTTMYQRQIAEKLISEVLFLAKTEKLNYDSKIESPSCSRCRN